MIIIRFLEFNISQSTQKILKCMLKYDPNDRITF
jgi:hypothetical protein